MLRHFNKGRILTLNIEAFALLAERCLAGVEDNMSRSCLPSWVTERKREAHGENVRILAYMQKGNSNSK
jgi:hypothetical protein